MSGRTLTAARWIGAGLVAAAGASHLYLYVDYFHRVSIIGPMFLVNAGSAAVVAVAIAAWNRVAPLVAGLLYAAGTLAAFLISVEVGLFGFHERLRGPWQERAGAVEALAVLLFAVLIAATAHRDPTRLRAWRRRRAAAGGRG